jgi:hypothetical protein
MVKRLGKYQIGHTLGEGSFGKCVAAAVRGAAWRAHARSTSHVPRACATTAGAAPGVVAAVYFVILWCGVGVARALAVAAPLLYVLVCRVKYAVNTETGKAVAIKMVDKELIRKQNMGFQIKKEVG